MGLRCVVNITRLVCPDTLCPHSHEAFKEGVRVAIIRLQNSINGGFPRSSAETWKALACPNGVCPTYRRWVHLTEEISTFRLNWGVASGIRPKINVEGDFSGGNSKISRSGYRGRNAASDGFDLSRALWRWAPSFQKLVNPCSLVSSSTILRVDSPL